MRKSTEIFREEYKAHKESGVKYFIPELHWEKIIEEFGDIAILEEHGDCQGDYLVLYDNDGLFGYSQISYGSCSGCDALQAAESWEEVDDIIEDEYNRIQWFDSPFKAIKFLKAKDWDLTYYFPEEGKAFSETAIKYLNQQIVRTPKTLMDIFEEEENGNKKS